jgi:hypothetical protein
LQVAPSNVSRRLVGQQAKRINEQSMMNTEIRNGVSGRRSGVSASRSPTFERRNLAPYTEMTLEASRDG